MHTVSEETLLFFIDHRSAESCFPNKRMSQLLLRQKHVAIWCWDGESRETVWASSREKGDLTKTNHLTTKKLLYHSSKYVVNKWHQQSEYQWECHIQKVFSTDLRASTRTYAFFFFFASSETCFVNWFTAKFQIYIKFQGSSWRQ